MSGRPGRVLLLFVDGIGIGRNDPVVNPFFADSYATLRTWCGGEMIHLGDMARRNDMYSVVPIDATLGVEGLPQSGTGQTALYTGINAPLLIGKHFGPYVYSTLRPLLAKENIFRRVQAMGRKISFANAYPTQYFEYLQHHPSRTTATALAWQSTGIPFNDANALAAGTAVSADITNERWGRLGYPQMPVISPEEAGRRLARLSAVHDLVVYEFYYTDHAGHAQNMAEGIGHLRHLDAMLGGLLSACDADSTTIVMTSDHGNLEDLSSKSHTRNPVPLFTAGRRHEEIADSITDLTHITPAILHLLT